MTLLSAVLVVSVALYLAAMRIARTATDYRFAERTEADASAAAEAGTPDGETSSAALLAGEHEHPAAEAR